MKSFPIEGIPASSYFTQAVYLDEHFVLAAPETPIGPDLVKAVIEWEFNTVHSEGEPCESYAPTPDTNTVPMDKQKLDRSSIIDLEKIQKAERFYATFQRYVESLYSQLAFRSKLNYAELTEQIKYVCNFVKEDRRYLMRVQQHMDPSKDKDYLICHTVRSTVIAIIIGTYLKLPSHRLIELGIAALLHEIGMVKLPQDYFLIQRPLTEQEIKTLKTHPVIGYRLLKLCNFPLMVSLAVLEHHERENGTGYPQKLTGNKLNLYSKIIAVACSYEAILAKRPHKEAKDGYTGMLELLKNEGKQYDDTVVRALVYSLSIYPIGMYVLLSNDRKGQVVDVNPENPRFPIVQVFGDVLPNGKNRILDTSPDGISIVRALTPEEIS
ncbi:MAG: HD-GYP domain-containing protein [Treponema sp.]|nr:HD-GYP domain-containing protein [Treponema sp.]